MYFAPLFYAVTDYAVVSHTEAWMTVLMEEKVPAGLVNGRVNDVVRHPDMPQQ